MHIGLRDFMMLKNNKAAMRKFSFSFQFDSDNLRNIGSRNMKSCMKTDCKHLVCVDDVNFLDSSKNTIKEN
jgi:hypothetical protein